MNNGQIKWGKHLKQLSYRSTMEFLKYKETANNNQEGGAGRFLFKQTRKKVKRM